MRYELAWMGISAMKKQILGLVGCLAIVALVGCSSSASVTGMVTASGETVNGGSLVFQPVEEGVKPAIGKIASDGAYKLQTAGDSGVVPGQYKVVYMPPDQHEDEMGRPIGKPIKWRQYQAPGEPVTVESNENTIAIELVKR